MTTGLFTRISSRRRWIAIEILVAALTAFLAFGLAELLLAGGAR